jgi:hypothetical protein
LNVFTELDRLTEARLIQLSENKLRKEVLIPLLRDVGIHNLEDCHGIRECGVDILFVHNDMFGRPKLFGIQCKRGDIIKQATTISKSIITIHNQIREAFLVEFTVPGDPKGKKYIDGYYVIASGKINQYAKNYIRTRCHEFPYIDFLDGKELLRIVSIRHRLNREINIDVSSTSRSFLAEPEDVI